MKPTIRLVALIVILFASVSYADTSQDQECLYPGEWPIRGPESVIFTKCGEDDIRVRIGMHELDFNDPDPAYQGRIESVCPDPSYYRCRTLVKNIEIIFNNKTIVVNSSTFFGLYDLHGAEIRKKSDRYFLILSGGDGAESYHVKLDFDENGAKDHLLTQPKSDVQH